MMLSVAFVIIRECATALKMVDTMLSKNPFGLYDKADDKSSCGVGFLTRKDGIQSHDLLRKVNQALCSVPHRGGMSAEGVGDGAGVTLDLSVDFFSKLVGVPLKKGHFGVGNFFMPSDASYIAAAEEIIESSLVKYGMSLLLKRDVEVDLSILSDKAVEKQLSIKQWIFRTNRSCSEKQTKKDLYNSLMEIESKAFTDEDMDGLYPLSISASIQVLKGRLTSSELVPFFRDLNDPDHKVHSAYFHTRFSTNTEPHPSMAQPFRLIAHNGELNTDKKNRLSEAAIAQSRNRNIIRPKGQSDSCRLDQTLNARVVEDDLDLVASVVSMMPPAWENDKSIDQNVREMLEFFSLYEEKNDGPAALIFGDGNIIGARLDRLGLRPLRTIETTDYLAAMSEAGQVDFPEETVLSRGRIEAGGILYYDHSLKKVFNTPEALSSLAEKRQYGLLLKKARFKISDIPDNEDATDKSPLHYDGDLNRNARYVAYSHNQESFRFLMDPMLESGLEKVSAMGYGNAINALSDNEGGVAKYFSQRFAQVTNPPLDSIREADGMTLRLALGEKPGNVTQCSQQIIIESPLLSYSDILKISSQDMVPVGFFDALFEPVANNFEQNKKSLISGIESLCDEVENFVKKNGGIAIVSDRQVCKSKAAIPMVLATSAINQRLIEAGVRLKVSLIVESGQISSSHHIACVLGFGAAAVYPLAVQMRSEEKFGADAGSHFTKFAKAAEKSLMKTMGKVGLCTVESYSSGEFFEPNFLDVSDPVLAKYFPSMKSPVGGVGFLAVAQAASDWHERALSVFEPSDIPMLGLFKERSEGAGHSYGATAVRGFVDLTEEPITLEKLGTSENKTAMRLFTLDKMTDAFGLDDKSYSNTSFEKISKKDINNFEITPGFRDFSRMMKEERERRPAALRDVLAFPADISYMNSISDITKEMMRFNRAGNNTFIIRGLRCEIVDNENFKLSLTGKLSAELSRLNMIAQSLIGRFGNEIIGHWLERGALIINAIGEAADYLKRIRPAMDPVDLVEVEPASSITPLFTSGAMSHGALVANAHEAVAHGTNMVGGLSNCGEGGEHISRFGTIRASRIKQFASGRFGVWAAYLADPMLEEIEIKIGQGAKPGEGGQLPASKVSVEIAAARGGTPGVELISPPPHHDTYSIEDLAQLIHDAKAARVRVIVKLVSSDGIGTIAVGVAKAGADVINVAGGTGGTGAASVTSLKYTGRAAEIGVAEVHQALCANGLRAKVVLRCSGAHQTGSDVVKSALMGGDSFEFGTTALMMLKCVMAKNCNVKCPAGLTTNPEIFEGDPRALAQYLLNVAHEVREVLAKIGLKSLLEARGRSELLHLLDHPLSVGQLNVKLMLQPVSEVRVLEPKSMDPDFSVDDNLISDVKNWLRGYKYDQETFSTEQVIDLSNVNKSVGGQLAVDIERILNYETKEIDLPIIKKDKFGRRNLSSRTVEIKTRGSAGQSYGLFCNDGMIMRHEGTCNDGVGKSACGGEIIISAPSGNKRKIENNVLIGNFALFGATGGRLFIEGQAGDRFAVRNSGATAVVEGVGDFFAEYMTNGAVLNIGSFSKGYGNGMSGGFAYQYDPKKKLMDNISKDSVLLGSIDDGTDVGDIHAKAIHVLLTWHLEATKSSMASYLLENWSEEKKNFSFVMPISLLQYQDSDVILASKTRKDLLDELATYLAKHQVSKLKVAWKNKIKVVDGATPNVSEKNSNEMFELLNTWTVLNEAQAMALKNTQDAGSVDDPQVLEQTRNLIFTEDFRLMTKILRHARNAIDGYNDSELAAMIATKRINDFKAALSLRNILSMDGLGTSGWIMHQQYKNGLKLGEIESFDKLLTQQLVSESALNVASN